MGSISETSTQNIKSQLSRLLELVDPSEVINDSSDEYLSNTEPWSTGKDQHPKLVLCPKSIESLAKVVGFLFKTSLDYKVRSRGFGSASARDVLISLTAFDDFEFNREEEHVILGAGGTWGEFYSRMEAVAPDWTIVGARTPSIGIGGSTLSSGFSWLSSEYGCVSDPVNMLDARVVKPDGEILWASSDPELLWSLRGAESGFAIVTHFKFRARPYPENGKIWAGPILLPKSSAAEIAKGMIEMVEKDNRGELGGKTAMFLYTLHEKYLASGGANDDMLVVHAFDARGAQAGREEFKWALEIEGAIDSTRSDMTLRNVSALQQSMGDMRGKQEMFWSAVALTGEDRISESIILKSFDWWVSMLDEPGSIADHGMLILELFSCRDSLTGQHSSAWPRPKGYKHMLLLGSGCKPNSEQKIIDKARTILLDAPISILGKPTSELSLVPNCLDVYHDADKLYGEHLPKLREIKTRVDPQNRLKGWIRPL